MTVNREYLRIVLGRGRKSRYVTLSHQWSTDTRLCSTTTANLGDRLHLLDEHSLAPVFRDCIQLCRQLGLRYLWIDSLCIMQDDADDWRRECKKMASIFEQSYLNISALAACRGASLFYRTAHPGYPPCNVVMKTQDGIHFGIRQKPRMIDGEDKFSAMSSRGWILQERMLSPAIVHFGRHQMHWEC